mgnify:CR=1 FL=1
MLFRSSNINCASVKEVIDATKVQNEIKIDDLRKDSIYIYKLSNKNAFIIEIQHVSKDPVLVAYSLSQDERPPIKIYRSGIGQDVFDMTDMYNIGKKIRTPGFDVLISDIKDNQVWLNFIPLELSQSDEAKVLDNKALGARTAEIGRAHV